MAREAQDEDRQPPEKLLSTPEHRFASLAVCQVAATRVEGSRGERIEADDDRDVQRAHERHVRRVAKGRDIFEEGERRGDAEHHQHPDIAAL